jgi:hypothetical protein
MSFWWPRKRPGPPPRWGVDLYIEPRDFWVGAYFAGWRDDDSGARDLYVCPVPCLVVKVWWYER